jgi:uncharacterized protein
MESEQEKTYATFAGDRLVASGNLGDMLRCTKEYLDGSSGRTVLIFDDQTGDQVDFDFRGSLEEVWERVAPRPKPAGPGRPRLGVVGREVSLMPRHWEWLDEQPNGASAAIRRLVEEARKRNPGEGKARAAINAAGKFMWSMAGNLPRFEEASRALYARSRERFAETTRSWPPDVRAYVERLAGPGLTQ